MLRSIKFGTIHDNKDVVITTSNQTSCGVDDYYWLQVTPYNESIKSKMQSCALLCNCDDCLVLLLLI